jgi:hypothetical protein
MNRSTLTLTALSLFVIGAAKASAATYTSSQEYVDVESNIKTPNGNSIYVF